MNIAAETVCRSFFGLAAAAVLIVFSLLSPAGAVKRIYTTSADFNAGVLTGVEDTSVADQLQLATMTVRVPVVWIPNQDGTVSKLNAINGKEVGRYRVVPPGLPGEGDPARTAVDPQGNCWVGNRQAGTVVKIGLVETGQWIDRSGDGVCQTSKDLNDDGDITGPEVLPWGEDECVLYEVVLIAGREGTFRPGAFPGPYDTDFWGTSPLGLACDSKGNLWAGSLANSKYYYIDGASGAILRVIDLAPFNHDPYGAVIDSQGILWSIGPGYPFVLRMDPSTDPPSVRNYFYWQIDTNAICLDSLGHLFVAGWSSPALSRINTATGSLEWSVQRSDIYYGNGIACGRDDDVWVTGGYFGVVARFGNDGTFKTSVPIGNMTSGVSVDSSGKVWVCNFGDEYVKRVDPLTNSVDLSKQIVGSFGHDGYTDMTGTYPRQVFRPSGTWSAVLDGGVDTPWGIVTWTANEPAGTSVSVRLRASNDQTTWTDWVTAVNGSVPASTVRGRYVEVEATLSTSLEDVSPVLYDLSVKPANNPPDVSGAYPSLPCLWPANRSFANVTIQGVTDLDGDTVSIKITGITSDEPTADGKGKNYAKYAPDAYGVGTSTAEIRAERIAGGNGRVYQVSFLASDGKGGETPGWVNVDVPSDILLGTDSAIDDGQRYDATVIN